MPGGAGSVDPDARREIGEVETERLGRLRIAISRDSIAISGVNIFLEDVDKTLRESIIAASAAFASAENDVEQATQKNVIGVLVDSILRRDKTLEASVRAAKLRERFDV
jgi:hypothetical protein